MEAIKNQTKIERIGFSGSCHWCTEAVFQTLKGVTEVQQGWISAVEDETFHEGVLVDFRREQIPLAILIEVHLRTHSSTSEHKLRKRYRSGIYTFTSEQHEMVDGVLTELAALFTKPLITKNYRFREFQTSAETFQNYYRKNPEKPFCKSYIDPKLKLIFQDFSRFVKH